MNFEILPPDLAIKLQGGWASKIYATGEIDPGDGEKFSELLIRNAVPPGSQLYLDSPGGSLTGGLSLGRVIREFGLNTYVGKKGKFENGFQFSDDGICLSASALCFLGGIYRFVDRNSQFGVHQFRFDGEVLDGVSSAQRLSASVLEYIRAMGVDQELFSIASDVHAVDMLILPWETLLRLGVVNNGFERPEWTIESIEGCLYLKGARRTIYGVQKYMIVFPSDGPPYLYFVFGIEGHSDAALAMDVDRFEIDDEYINAREFRISRFVDNGFLNAMYALPEKFFEKIAGAKTVGYCLQFSEEAAVFLGIGGFPLNDAASKLPGLIAVHGRAGS